MFIDPTHLEASVCRDSFYDFVQRFWSVVIPEKPIWNWHIRYICDVLQEAAERVMRGEPKLHDYVINVPPGSSKSTICSVMFPAWVWTRMPTARSICASYSHPLAMDLSRKSRDVVQSEKWVKLFGDIKLREDQNTKSHFVNEDGGMRYCVGTEGSVTGFHGHFIIIDDPLNPLEAVSDADLRNANTWITETLETRKVDKEVSVIILIMQRLHQNDPSAVLLRRRDEVRHIRLPAEIHGTGLDQVRPRGLVSHYDQGLLDPRRMSRRVLKSMRAALGEYGYSGQMLQNPVPRGGGMFKVERVQLEDGAPKGRHFTHQVRFWDKAGTRDGTGAFTAGVLMARDVRGAFWILDVVRGRWDSGARERKIRQVAELDTRVVEVGLEQEPGSGGKESAQNTVRSLAGFRVRVVRPTGDKVLRADPFSTQVNGENVYVLNREWTRAYLEELQYFPHSTFKDQVDASSGAFTVLTQAKVRVGGLGRKVKV